MIPPGQGAVQSSKLVTILVGSLPPPLTGQTVAFQIACEGFRDQQLPIRVFNLSTGAHSRPEGRFSLLRFLQLLGPFAKGLSLLLGQKNLYLSVSQNWVGFLRDGVFILFAALGRQRIVIHVHGGYYDGFYSSLGPLQKYLVRSVLRRVDRVLILGRALSGMFDFEPSLRGRTVVLFNGLPYDAADTPARPKRLPPSSQGRPKLLFLSNLIVSKGYLQVLEALRILVHKLEVDAECHFCGSFVLASDIRPYSSPEAAEADFYSRIRAWGLAKHAFWHGPVDGTRKVRFLRDSQFFLLPTCYRYEAQPISIIEALAFGLVVIATPFRTIPEMVEEGRVGELIPFEEPERVAQAVESYIRNPAKFEAMSRASIERYRGAFTREQHLARLIPLVLG